MLLSLKRALKLNPSINHRLASCLRKALHVFINEQELLIVSLSLNQRRSQLPLRAAAANGQRFPLTIKGFPSYFTIKILVGRTGFLTYLTLEQTTWSKPEFLFFIK